ncbi:DNA binding protein [Pseudomonas sp. S75]|uniref:histone-like nucleoid-structuring protein, MvaT/MvaU family n=1 Tax=Pseudomonas sp. S75 TaxID=2767446 RepID=UPI00190B408D|nr:histone-like nucleoid-structuring protein, MvaT/MvaU family [Pseudomonas sp. S75]MBK0155547.1 DNA binding protein [Pseudomonas sp. S75]
MSRLVEFRQLEQQLATQLAELESLKNDVGLQREIEFEQKLRTLMGEYGVGLREVIGILDPTAAARTVSLPAVGRKSRAVKVFKNPHTGEVIETKGGNHKGLKKWRDQYGIDAVTSWLQ